MKIEVYSPTIRRKEMDAVLTAMVEDKIGPGERGRLLVQTAKEHLSFDYALSLRSPVIALHLALEALNLQRGSSVIISALSPRYYARVIAGLGLCPLYCDVSVSLPCMTRETIEACLQKTAGETNARCIVLHHTLGFSPDTASIAELGLPVIEDISQSFAAAPPAEKTEKEGKAPPEENAAHKEKVRGVFTILGLEERDMLTSGGGALLCASNRKDSALLRAESALPPEYCLPDINAALAVVQFKEALRNSEKRAEIARVYTQASLRSHHKKFIPLEDGVYNNYAFALVLETGLKDVLAYARKKDILVESAFEQTLAGEALDDEPRCPVSRSLSLRTVLFPLYPRLRGEEIERVSKLIMTLP